jgi:hypothetical protein
MKYPNFYIALFLLAGTLTISGESFADSLDYKIISRGGPTAHCYFMRHVTVEVTYKLLSQKKLKISLLASEDGKKFSSIGSVVVSKGSGATRISGNPGRCSREIDVRFD